MREQWQYSLKQTQMKFPFRVGWPCISICHHYCTILRKVTPQNLQKCSTGDILRITNPDGKIHTIWVFYILRSLCFLLIFLICVFSPKPPIFISIVRHILTFLGIHFQTDLSKNMPEIFAHIKLFYIWRNFNQEFKFSNSF